MHARERIIRKRFAAQSCAQCGLPRAGTSLLILARRRDTWLVLVTCAHCDHRGIYVVSFAHSANPHEANDWQAISHDTLETAMEVRTLSSAELAAATIPGNAPREVINLDDVAQMRAFLQTFDGNFRRVFAES